MKKLLLVTTALVALAAGPAQADPISAVGSIFIATGIAGPFVAVELAKVALGVGLGFLSSAVSAALVKKPGVEVKFTAEFGDDRPLSFIVGDYATAGRRKYIGSWGGNNRYVTEVIEVSCLPQPGLQALWVNDEKVDILWGETDTDGTPHDLGHPIQQFSDSGHSLWIRWYDGTQTAADPLMQAAFGSDPDYPWTAAFIGTGKTYAVMTWRYETELLSALPTYLFQPAPLPVYDPRKDSTAGGVGSHRWGNRATYEPSRNTAVIAYNIARGVHYGSEWIYGGKNLAAWRLPMAEWVAAMNASDAAVALAGGGSEPAYLCGAEITVDMEPAGILEEIGRAGNMRIAEVGGRLKPLVDLPGAAVFSITDGDIVITEGQSLQPFYPVSETYNAIQATYPEPGEKWASKDAPEFIDTAATAADGGRYLPVAQSYGACPYPHQVQRLMRAQLQDYRRMRRHQFHLPPDAYGLEPGDMLSWTSAHNGYVSKLFLVEQVQKLAGMSVAVSLREVDPGDYDWSTGYQLPTNIITPKNLVPWTQAVPGFNAEKAQILDEGATARRPAIKVSCAADQVGATEIRIQFRVKDTAPVSVVSRPYIAPYSWLLPDVLPATTYQIRALLVSELTGKSAWTGWLEVTSDDIRIGASDLAASVYTQMAEIAEEAGIKPVASLPASGDPDQIVMLTGTGQLYRWNATTSAWTTTLYSGIAPGSVDITKIAGSLEVPLTHTGAVPTTRQDSDLLYRTNDGKLYRWNGTAYVASVPSSDIAGTITSTQIADNSITTGKLAANAVEAGNISAGAVTAGKIAADAITTGTVAAGAIGAREIAAGSILASKLVVSDITNLNADSLYNDLAFWLRTSTATFTAQSLGGTWENARGVNLTSPAGGTNAFAWASRPFPVSPGEEFYVWGEFGVVAPDGTTAAGVRLQFSATEDMATVTNVLALSTTEAPRQTPAASVTAPAGMYFARLMLMKTGGSTSVTARFGKIQIRRKNAGHLIVDGSITANKVAAGAIETDKLAAGAVVASKLAAGSVTAVKIDTMDFGVAGLAIFGGTLKSSNYVAGLSGWQITDEGDAEVNSLIVRRDMIVVGAVSDTWSAARLPSFANTPGNTTQLTLEIGATSPDDFIMISCFAEFTTGGNSSYSMRFQLEGYDGASWSVLSTADISNGNTFKRGISRALILGGGFENARVQCITRDAGGTIENLRVFARRLVR